MAKLASAAEFITNMKSGKYENKTNAQRAAGRTRLSPAEKDKVIAAIEAQFPDDGSAPPVKKVSKKTSKKTSKKVSKKASKKVARAAPPPAEAASETAAPEAPPAKAAKKAKKKVAARKKVTTVAKATPPGTLPISPSQVQTTGDLLTLIDSTVTQSVSIMNALQRADEIHKAGDISEGVSEVKKALVGAAQLLQQSVVAPLRHVGSSADPEVAGRLEAVVRASNDPFAQQLGVPGSEQQPMPQPMHQEHQQPS